MSRLPRVLKKVRWLAALLLVAPGLHALPEEAADGAIARGASWLRGEQSADGSFGQGAGETALALLALRHSGAPAGERACLRAAARLERLLPDGTVYGASLGILALLAQDRARHQATVARLVADLVAGQCRNGQWTYAYRSTATKKGGDNSNTQLAILALAAARAQRLEVPAATFQRCHAFFLATQNADGGFGYSDKQRSNSYGSMTAGGAMVLALAAPEEGLAGERPEVRRALDWLGRDLDVTKNAGAGRAFGGKKANVGDAFWRTYWLWSLERAAASAGAEEIGGRDWHALGTAFLLGAQRDDGSWSNPEKPLQATCFALLFLTRSTRATLTPRDRDAPLTPRWSD
ncbi:MAG: prenyltransferase/squalene oxidase repeat-containing protein [Planctomycetaceae bacterium]